MAAAYRSSASTAGTTGTSAACNKPTGTVDGDVMVMRVAASDSATFAIAVDVTLPSGWTLLQNSTYSSDGQTWRQVTAYKLAASEGSSYTVNFTVASVSTSAYSEFDITTVSGPDQATPVQASTTNNGASTTATGTGITANRDSSCLIRNQVSILDVRTSSPSGMTNRQTYDGNVYTDTQDSISAGATGDKTNTFAASQGWVVHMVLVQPPGAAAVGDQAATSNNQRALRSPHLVT